MIQERPVSISRFKVNKWKDIPPPWDIFPRSHHLNFPSSFPSQLPTLGVFPTFPNKFLIILRFPLSTPRVPTAESCSTLPFGRKVNSWECRSESLWSEKSPSTYRNTEKNTFSRCLGEAIWIFMVDLWVSLGNVSLIFLRFWTWLNHWENVRWSQKFSFSAYARSILTTPWVELGDRVTICCPQSGYNAAVTFHTKPFYGGTLHKITGEVKGPDGQSIVWFA